MGSLTEMLDTLEEHSDIRNSTSKPAEETTMATCIRDQRVGDTAYIEDIEPVRLRKRLVLRSNVPIPTGALRRLHESYKDAEGFINQILVDDVELTKMSMEISGKYRSGRSEEEYILFRCALREVYQGCVIPPHLCIAAD